MRNSVFFFGLRVLALCLLSSVATNAADRILLHQKSISSSSANDHDCTVSISTDKPSYEVGDLVALKAIVTNHSNHVVHLLMINPVLSYRITLLQPSGKKARTSLYYDSIKHSGILSIKSETLKPDEQISECINLSQSFDLSQKGKYRASVSKIVSFAKDASTEDLVSSNIIEFRISEAKNTKIDR